MKFFRRLEGSIVGHSMVVFTFGDDEEAEQSAIAKLEQDIREYLPHAETFVLGDPRWRRPERCEALQRIFNAGYARITSEWTRRLEGRRVVRSRTRLRQTRCSPPRIIGACERPHGAAARIARLLGRSEHA